MNWYNILKIERHPAARDVFVLLVEAGFPSQYIKQLKVAQWGIGDNNILYQIPPNYLISVAEDFNTWLDDRDREYLHRFGGQNRPKTTTTDEESIQHIETLINQAIHSWEQDKLEGAKGGRFE